MRLAMFEINGVSRIGVVPDDDPSRLIDASPAEGTPSDVMAAPAGSESPRRPLARFKQSPSLRPGAGGGET